MEVEKVHLLTSVKQEIKEESEDSDLELEETLVVDEEDVCLFQAPTDHDYFSQRLAKTVGVNKDSLPRLEILEQPCSLIRFRYLSELQGTPHGPLTGTYSTKHNRTFPSVQLLNWTGKAIIRCWLVDNSGHLRLHVHDLVARKKGRNQILYEPHARIVDRSNKYIARFDNLVVIRTAKKEGIDKYYKKKLEYESCYVDSNLTSQGPTNKEAAEIILLFNTIDKNSVCLLFEAITLVENKIRRLCCVTSNPIRNLKDPESAELRILRCSSTSGSSAGGDTVFIFVKKIPKDIKVEFFDDGQDDGQTWCDYALFSLSDIHCDCAIAFETPPYPFPINSARTVHFRLYRPGDQAYSNPVEFTYLPAQLVSSYKKIKIEMPSPEYQNEFRKEYAECENSLPLEGLRRKGHLIGTEGVK